MKMLLSLCIIPRISTALVNGAALTPPLGYTPWNGFKMNFNSSLMLRTAHAMKANGMLDAGYDLLTIGGSTYAHSTIAPWNKHGPMSNVMVRNSTV